MAARADGSGIVDPGPLLFVQDTVCRPRAAALMHVFIFTCKAAKMLWMALLFMLALTTLHAKAVHHDSQREQSRVNDKMGLGLEQPFFIVVMSGGRGPPQHLSMQLQRGGSCKDNFFLEQLLAGLVSARAISELIKLSQAPGMFSKVQKHLLKAGGLPTDIRPSLSVTLPPLVALDTQQVISLEMLAKMYTHAESGDCLEAAAAVYNALAMRMNGPNTNAVDLEKRLDLFRQAALQVCCENQAACAPGELLTRPCFYELAQEAAVTLQNPCGISKYRQ